MNMTLAILPVAGEGTRIRPHTYSKPKAMLYVAGKPILSHIIDSVVDLGINKFIFVVGYLKNKIINYIESNYPDLEAYFVYQDKRLGLGHAIYLTKPYVDDSALIIYGDTIFDGNISDAINDEYDGMIGVKLVQDPRRFGVVELEQGVIKKLVEKPNFIRPMPAIVGINYISDYKLLFDSLEYIIENDIKTKDEYQLTDAFQVMVDKGAKMGTFEVNNWYDCGTLETLLMTNKHLLDKYGTKVLGNIENSVIIEPVYIGNAYVKNSVIGPYVSIADSAVIESSILSNSIINNKAVLKNVNLQDSIVGEEAYFEELPKKVSLGDNSYQSIK